MVKNSSFGKLLWKRCTDLHSKTFIGDNYKDICNATHDSILCWAPTRAGETVTQRCPPLRGFNPTKFAYRHCGHGGVWENWNNSLFMIDKTNFQECLVLNKPTDPKELEDIKDLIETAKITNIVGISLLVISLLSMCIAFFIYYAILPKFVNSILHVRIHKQIYLAIILESIVELTNHIMALIQLQNRSAPGTPFSNYWFLCEILTTLNQYAELAILLWMAIDAHFIQITARSGNLCTSGYLTYCIVGWGVPIVPTSIWAVTLVVSHKVRCWVGFSRLPTIWIMEIPKLLSLLATLVLLCLALWRLHDTLKKGKNLDAKKLKHELVMAGLFFIFMSMSILFSIIPTQAPIDGNFVVWQYVATITISLRGIFLSVFYSFLNKDVHNFIKYSQTRLPLKNENTFTKPKLNADNNKAQTFCCVNHA